MVYQKVQRLPYQPAIKHELKHVVTTYNKVVDDTLNSDVSADEAFTQQTGHSLADTIQNLVQNSDYGKHLPERMQHNSRTYEIIEEQAKAYARFKHGQFDNSTTLWQNPVDIHHDNKPMSPSEIVSRNIGFAFIRNDNIAADLADKAKKQAHIKSVNKISELKFGDVIQIYQPYDEDNPKQNAKNAIERHGQNRFYGILGHLPNGDVLAVDFRGHRNRSQQSVPLEYDPQYAYPSSTKAQPSLDKGDRLLIQLPKDAIKEGSALREKYEAAAHGKPYDPVKENDIKIYEMSPKNIEKMRTYYDSFNARGRNITWSNRHNEVEADSIQGKRMLNPEFHIKAQLNVTQGVYQERNLAMTRRLDRQAAIREARYGDTSTKKIQTKTEVHRIDAERQANAKKTHGPSKHTDVPIR